MSMQAFRSVIETALSQWAAANGIQATWENDPTPISVPYAAIRLMPGESRTLSTDGKTEARVGVVQVTLVMSAGGGPNKADSLFDSLVAAINPSTILGSGDARAWLTSPFSRAAGFQFADTYQVPISARYWTSVSLV